MEAPRKPVSPQPPQPRSPGAPGGAPPARRAAPPGVGAGGPQTPRPPAPPLEMYPPVSARRAEPARPGPAGTVPATVVVSPAQTAAARTQKAAAPTPAWQPLIVSRKDRMLFFRQFATLVKAGISVGSALNHLGEQATHPALREGARKAQICVEGGGRLSAWMRTRPQLFTRADCVLVLVGETSGDIDKMLDRIASDLEDESALQRRLFLATFLSKYVVLPLLVLVPGMANIMVYGVDALDKSGVGKGAAENDSSSVAAQQRVILEAGLKGYFHDALPRLIIAALLVVAFTAALRWLPLSAWGRRLCDQVSLWIPGTGRLWRDRAVSRYLTALGLLTNAGLTAPAALEASAGIADNIVLDEKFDQAAALSRKTNQPLAEALAGTGLLTGTALSMIRTGDRSGSTPEMMHRVAEYYSNDVQNRLITVPKLIGTVCMMVCGIATAIVVGGAARMLFENMFTSVDKFMGGDS